MPLIDNSDLLLHRCDHARIAEWSLFAHGINNRLPKSCRKILHNIIINNKVIYCRLEHPKDLESLFPSAWIKTYWKFNDKKQLIPIFDFLYKLPNGSTHFIENLHIDSEEKIDETICGKFDNTLTTFLNDVFLDENWPFRCRT